MTDSPVANPPLNNPFAPKDDNVEGFLKQQSPNKPPNPLVSDQPTVNQGQIHAAAPKIAAQTAAQVQKTQHNIELDQRRDRILKKSKILEQYGNLESNIPLNHEYWTLQ